MRTQTGSYLFYAVEFGTTVERWCLIDCNGAILKLIPHSSSFLQITERTGKLYYVVVNLGIIVEEHCFWLDHLL